MHAYKWVEYWMHTQMSEHMNTNVIPVFSRVSAHLRVSAIPAHMPRKFQALRGAYSGDRGSLHVLMLRCNR